MDAEVASRTIVPLISVPFIRNLALGGLVITLISWGDAEVHRKRQLTPLSPLLQHRGVSKASVTLPPFLPEEISNHNVDSTPHHFLSFGDEEECRQAPELALHRKYGTAKFSQRVESFYTKWKRTREHRRNDALNARRKSIYSELVALQSSKKQNSKSADSSSLMTGFALVTGASTGIGRALATELARWGISLILVARNQEKLLSLAHDLEACYGVRCCVLPADLSVADAAESIHRTTTNNGLTVDILVNNAGVATSGLAVESSTSEIERLLFVNTLSSAKLTILYGSDMATRRRGRILMVSSMAGLVSSVPNAAIYGATKAFLKSLSSSISKELEKFGIGVTTLLPGAVTTDFRHSSGMENALCWRLPLYSRPVESVAHLAITSLMDGDTEVVPGLLNRLFAKVVRPLLPRRLEAICIEAAFKPISFPRSLFVGQLSHPREVKSDEKLFDDARRVQSTGTVAPGLLSVPTQHSPPRLLQLEKLQHECSDEDHESGLSSADNFGGEGGEVSEGADTGPENPNDSKEDDLEDMQFEVTDAGKEPMPKDTNHTTDYILPNSRKTSCHRPNLLLQESLLQSEKGRFQ